jgi:hypothetical protein
MRVTASDVNRQTWRTRGYVAFASYAEHSKFKRFISCCRERGIDIKTVPMSGGRVIRVYKTEYYLKGAE